MLKIKKSNIFRLLFLLTILVTLTKTYVVFAVAAGTSVGVITTLFFGLNIILILNNLKALEMKQGIFLFSVFIVFIPFIVSFVNFNFSLNALMLQLFYFSQVLIGVIAIKKYPLQLSNAVILAVLINFSFGVFSMFNPQFFIGMSEIINARSFYGGRAVSFFLQPNTLGLASVVLYILCKFLCSKKTQQLLSPLIILTTVLTGSRSSIIVLLVLLLLSLILTIRSGQFKIVKILKPVLNFSLIIIPILLLFFNSKYAEMLVSNKDYTQLIDRFEFFIDFSADKVENDQSLDDRFNYQKKYIKELPSFFILGNGIGTQQEAIHEGTLTGSAHQAYLEILFQGGIFYLLSYILILYYMLFVVWRNRTLNPLKSKLTFFLFSFVFIISLVSTGILSMRELFLAFGIMLQYDLNRENTLIHENP